MAHTPLLSLALTCSLIAAEPQEQTRRGPLSQHSESTTIPARGLAQVQLRLARGSVTVRGTSTRDILMRVAQRSTSTDARVVTMRVSKINDVVRIASVHPSPLAYDFHECLHVDEELGDFWHYDVTVDVELELPAALALQVRTMRGTVDVSGFDSDLDVATNDGDVQLRQLHGNVTAAALGSIDIEILPKLTSRHIRLSTYAGDLRLRLPLGARVSPSTGEPVTVSRSASQLMSTEGSATSEVSLSIAPIGPLLTVALTRGRLMLLPIEPPKP